MIIRVGRDRMPKAFCNALLKTNTLQTLKQSTAGMTLAIVPKSIYEGTYEVIYCDSETIHLVRLK